MYLVISLQTYPLDLLKLALFFQVQVELSYSHLVAFLYLHQT